ncbi:MAG: HD domain-containing protein [Nitrososphaerota archaeon]|jgi:hypothetical protein|nr:HD domain-containing protein [Nitrososphaerota archaeon]MDG6932939.1 HD domain-containing protein [Nitrososphaerota archaeon]MDG6935750.1 HD domain-containing protein [Nitrososphaerota archaeon]MDG6944154.1 HD domain-containing protein [Nitrososphaerota archaeon]
MNNNNIINKKKETKFYLFNPDSIQIDDWSKNGEDNWKTHFRMLIENEEQDVKNIVNGFLAAIDNIYVTHFPKLPTYTEHYMTHSRNVARLAFKLMELNPNNFTETDVLIIALSSLFHDLGQYNPKTSTTGEEDRKNPNKSLESIYDEIINSPSLNNYKSILQRKKKFGKVLFNIALYHQKNMPFDSEYNNRYADLKNKGCVDKSLNKRTFEQALKGLKKEEIEHYKDVAAIFQLADGLDIQRFRETSIRSIIMRIYQILTELKLELKIKNEEVLDIKKSSNNIIQMSHLIKELLVSGVSIEKRDNNLKLIFNFNNTDDFSYLRTALKSMIKEIIFSNNKNYKYAEINFIDAFYYKMIELATLVDDKSVDKNSIKNKFFELIDLMNFKLQGSFNKEWQKDVEFNYIKSLLTHYVLEPILEELILTQPYIIEILNLHNYLLIIEIYDKNNTWNRKCILKTDGRIDCEYNTCIKLNELYH